MIPKNYKHIECVSNNIFCVGGREYIWSGWFGCQLMSFELFRPRAGTTRVFNINYDYNPTLSVYSTGSRRPESNFLVPVTWTLATTNGKLIMELHNKLCRLW